MTVITRYPTAPSNAGSLPVLAWETGLSPNLRWVPARLPADGEPVQSWTSQYGDKSFPAANPADPPRVETENGVRYLLTSGAANNGLVLTGINPSTMRTITVIARPNVGDTFATAARVFRIAQGTVSQATDSNFAIAQATTGFTSTSLSARLGKWHVYSISLPPVGTVGGTGVFAVDGASVTFNYSDPNWDSSILYLPATATTGRQVRIVEVITSAGSFDAATLTGLYAKAKAWYPGLEWAAATKESEEDEEG